ncbi:MAG: hypothetical protein ABI599_06015 [Flavobacteriales bacterium]
MKHTLLAIAFVAASGSSAQSLEYSFLNQPCGTILNCDSGCTACIVPLAQGAVFTGTPAVWHGIDACPHPITSGDNTVMTYGWPVIADFDHYVEVSGIAFSPMHIDSVIVRHSGEADGPQRLIIRYGANTTMPTTIVSDVVIPSSYSETLVTDLGCVAAEDGMIYGFFQLILQAYDGGSGAWMIDDLRIVATPCSATGINEVTNVDRRIGSGVVFDMLGKATGEAPANGAYLSGSKVVVIR